MLTTLVIVGVLIFIIIFGHYGVPERVDPDDFQEEPPADKIMQGAEPFELEGSSDVGFLLIHGFEGSPFTLRQLGRVLNEQGHGVIAPLLPGHGTSVHDFRKTRYQHWYRAVERIYNEQRPKYKKFFVVGFSMGGNLSMKLVSQVSRRMPPTGLILISAPVFLNGFYNGSFFLKDWRLLLSGFIYPFLPFVRKGRKVAAEEVLSPWVGYSEVFTSACVHSFKKNIPRVRKKLHEIQCPVCLIMATNDQTVSAENLYYIMRKISSQEKRSFVFTIDEDVTTRHLLVTHEQTREKVYHYILKFVDDALKHFDLHPAPPRKKKSWWFRRKQAA